MKTLYGCIFTKVHHSQILYYEYESFHTVVVSDHDPEYEQQVKFFDSFCPGGP